MSVIVHLIEASATGTLSMCQLLANYQAEASGNKVYVVYSRRAETPHNIENYFSDDVKLIYVDMSSVLGRLLSIKKVRGVLKLAGASQLIMHSSIAGFLGRFASIGLCVNRIYIPHCISFMRGDLSRLGRFLFERLERIASLVPCIYVACSESEEVAIRDALPSAEVALIENAIAPFGAGSPRRSGSNGKIKVITVGQIRAQKAPDYFAQIASKFRMSGESVEFVWVGDGDSDQRRALEHSGVHVLGWVEKDKVASLLSESDIYLSTARWEGLPVSLIEAQYAGLPVVASKCSGNVDVIDDGTTGILFDSVEHAAESISLLGADASLRRKLGLAGQEMSLERFSSDRYVCSFDELLALNS